MHWALQKFTEVQIGQTKKYPIEKLIHWKSNFPRNLSNTYKQLYQLFLNQNRNIPLY